MVEECGDRNAKNPSLTASVASAERRGEFGEQITREILHVTPVSCFKLHLIKSYISFTHSAQGGFYSILQNAACKNQELACSVVYTF